MLNRFLHITFRRWFRDPLNSLINLLGLSLGLCAALLILIFVWNEITIDKDQQQNNTIVRLVQGEWGLHAPALKNHLQGFPKIEKVARIDMMYGKQSALRNGDKLFSLNSLYFVDKEIFDILKIKFVSGDPETALSKPFSMVLTTEQAKIIFGNENPLGKTIRYSKSYLYTITGIVEPLKKSHLSFNALAPYEDIPVITGQEDFLSREDQWNYHYYLKLSDNANPSTTAVDLNQYLKALNWNHGKNPAFRFQPIEKVYFDNTVPYEFGIAHGNRDLVASFSFIGFFILLLAIINFINISTAKLADRTKEAAIKKTAGCSATRLRLQLLAESVLLSFIAMILALFVVELLLPAFRSMLNKPLIFNVFSFQSLTTTISIALFTGILAGIIPAFKLSSYSPAKVLKGASDYSKNKINLRGILITFQFIVSIALIIITTITWQQFSFLSSKSLGISLDNIIYTSLSPEIIKSKEAFKSALENHPGIQSVAYTNAVPGNITWQESFEIEGETKQFTFLPTTPEFLQMIGVELVEGNLFVDTEAEMENTILLNQDAVSFFGWKDPLNHIHHSDFWGKYQVKGVVKDFHFADATQDIGPLVILNSDRYARQVCIQFMPNQTTAVLSHLESTWQNFSPEFPLEYHFLKDNFNNYYHDLRIQGRIFLYFSLLAIVIASMGLYGMVAHLAVKRRKAICIRKIHGAKSAQLFRLLSSEIIIIILTAFVIAIPISYFIAANWLGTFPYHISIGWPVFALAGITALIISIITISGHVLKLARINPAEALRYE